MRNEEVEEYILKYSSIRKWFLKPNGERCYTPATEKQYIQYMKLWCSLADKTTPDKLAICKDIDKIRGVIAEGLREKHLAVRSIIYRLHPLNSFWSANGRQVKETYGGISEPLITDILREKGKDWPSKLRQ